jgi:hypothetical protein
MYSNVQYFHDDYWPIGIKGGAAVEFQLSSWLRISPGFGYVQYPLKYNSTPHISWSANLEPPSTSGFGFDCFNLNVVTRILWPLDTCWIRLFLQIGGGYSFERIGEITYSFGPGNDIIGVNAENRYNWNY